MSNDRPGLGLSMASPSPERLAACARQKNGRDGSGKRCGCGPTGLLLFTRPESAPRRVAKSLIGAVCAPGPTPNAVVALCQSDQKSAAERGGDETSDRECVEAHSIASAIAWCKSAHTERS